LLEGDPLPLAGDSRFRWSWPWIFLALTGLLSSTIMLKLGEIQYLEIIDVFQIVVLFGVFVQQGLKLRVFRAGLLIAALYLVFLIAVFCLSLVALRNPFFFPDDLSLLKHPVWITLSRMAELTVDAGIMIYLAQVFRRDRGKLLFTARLYYWTGVASAVFAILTLPLNLSDIADLGAYNFDHRLRGFYNEGGPYGLYLLSVILIGIALFYMSGKGRRTRLALGFIPIGIAFLGSQSKAAFLALGFMLVLDALLAKGMAKRLSAIGLLAVAVVVVLSVVDVPAELRVYRQGAELYERASNFQSKDLNFVYGRVAGAFIVPRMIEVHPWAGIGWGNYGIVRNNPAYRGASAWATIADEPGLGILGTAAEMGLPLTVFLLICLMVPFVYLHRLGAPLYIKNLALLQPIVHAFGGQLNLTYPWVATAFALALGYHHCRISAQTAAHNLPPEATAAAPVEPA
jgi:hypothetical protein